MLTPVRDLFSILSAVVLFVSSALALDHETLLTESLQWMDNYFDRSTSYLYSFTPAALTHETRSSTWYAAGLFARNGQNGTDIANANSIIRAILRGQYANATEQWYGDYQKYPEEPYVGSPHYAPSIYNSWDPNWRGFIGSTLIVIVEEFAEHLEEGMEDAILESLRVTSIGDSYRIGGVDGDNLYPSYSNPAIMRAFVGGWIGRKIGDQNLTDAGEMDAREVVDLFERDDTLSEFNSGTYAGVSLFALTLWAKYMPEGSLMREKGAEMVRDTWMSIAGLYHADMMNVAGPWDRTYGYDMNRYLSILALFIWGLVGKDNAPIAEKPFTMSHFADFAISPLISIILPFHATLLPASLLSANSSLRTFPGPHSFHTTAYSPPYDLEPRNISSYLDWNMTLGGSSFREPGTIGGPSKNSASFSPAVAQWRRSDGSVGWLSLWATESEMQVSVKKGVMEIEYPAGNASSVFTFLVGTNPFGGKREVAGLGDVEGVKISVSGNINDSYSLGFAGVNGGVYEPVNEFEFWNFTYTMPRNSTQVPRIRLDFAQ